MLRVVHQGGGRTYGLPLPILSTPLVAVDGIYVKLECLNPCGSVKDRIAAFILREAAKRGDLKPGQRIVEATSGNTGIAFSFYGAKAGHPVTIVMPEHMTQERKQLIQQLGAELILCSQEGSFAEAADIRDRLATELGAFNPDQFGNPLNVECHEFTTGAEIIEQAGTENLSGKRIAFVAGVGTGGTLIGVAKALKSAWTDVSAFAVEPAEAAVMTGGPNGPHGIGGIGDGFIPAIASDGADGLHDLIDGVVVVSTEEALTAAQALAEQHTLCVGVSAGANYVAAKRLAERFDAVITVFPDGHHKYKSSGLVAPSIQECPFAEQCNQNQLSRLLTEIELSD